MDPEREAVIVKVVSDLIDKHEMETPDVIKGLIAMYDARGPQEMADFYRDALGAFEAGWNMALNEHRGIPHLRVVE